MPVKGKKIRANKKSTPMKAPMKGKKIRANKKSTPMKGKKLRANKKSSPSIEECCVRLMDAQLERRLFLQDFLRRMSTS
jgi:hypothetical protein